jgi:hypothetical protein
LHSVQFHRSIFGPGGLWWEDDKKSVQGFVAEIRETTLGKVMSFNTGEDFPDDVFHV